MSKVSVSLDEQETIICMYPKQIQDFAEVYSCIPAVMNRLRKLAGSDPDCVRIEKEDDIGLFAQVPASWICIRRPRKVIMTDEQKAAAAARLTAARNNRKGVNEVE